MIRAGLAHGSCRGKERLPTRGIKRKRVGEQPHRGEMRYSSHATFEVADPAGTQPGALGQFFLRKCRGRS